MSTTPPAPAPAPAPASAGFWVVAVALGLLVSASSAPSPIFPVYQSEWGLSATAITVVFAVYAATLLVALLTVGSLSDHLGRRPVVLVGVLAVVVAMGVFAVAGSVGWLVAARALQGAGTGTVIGALGAWLLDLAGPRRAPLAQLVNGAVPPVGLTVGAVGAAVLVEYAPAPTRTPYLLLALALVVVAGVLLAVPDPAVRVPGALASLRPVVRVPAPSRRVLLVNVPSFVGSWALGGLFLSLGASVVAQVLGRGDHLVGGLIVASVAGVGAVVGLLTRHVRPDRVVLLGSVAFLVGPALMVLALDRASTPLFFVAAAISGIGFGAGFQGGLRAVLATAPPTERAGVLSAVYVLSYLAFGLPSVVAGLLAPSLGLRTVAEGYAVLVLALGAVGLVVGLSELRARTVAVPAPRRPDLPETQPCRD